MAARVAMMKAAQKRAKAAKEAEAFEAWPEETPGGEEEEGGEEKDGSEGSDKEVPHVHDKELFEWFFSLFKFLVWVSIFTVLNVAFRPAAAMNEYTTLWRSIISAEPDDFHFVSDVWGFLSGPVVSLLSPDFFASQQGYWPEDASQYIFGNRLLGNIRIRQVRVSSSACSAMQQHFLDSNPYLQKECFSEYIKSMDEGRNKAFSNFRRARDDKPLIEITSCEDQACPDEDGNITQCCTEFDHFTYRTYKELGESAVDYAGMFANYPGGGYIVDLKNSSTASEQIAELDRHGWIDLKTRAIFVDFSFYNPNVDLFLACRIVFEFLPSGLVKPYANHRVVQVKDGINFNNPATRTENILLVIQIMMITWLAYDEAGEMYRAGKTHKWRLLPALKLYCSDFWSLADCATIAIACVLLYLQFYQIEVVAELLKDADNMNSSKIQNMGFWAQQAQSLSGVQALILWLKVFKYAAVTHKLEKLFEAIGKSIPAALDLLFVYFIMIVAFAVSGHIIFGNDVPAYATMLLALMSSIRVALFGEYDWDSMYNSNRLLGPIWVFLFMLASGIFLINFLIGIFCEVYAEVMSAEDDGKPSVLAMCAEKIADILQLKKLHAKIADIEASLSGVDADGDGMVT